MRILQVNSNKVLDLFDENQPDIQDTMFSKEVPVSDCCGAPLLHSLEDPICSSCKEHCGI